MELIQYRMPWKPVQVMPVGDIQWSGNDQEVVIDKLARHIRWGVQQGAWFIGMGDYLDTYSPSNRRELEAARTYESADQALEDAPRGYLKQLMERALEPSVGRWLGLLAGHHWARFQDGTTSDQLLCRYLKAPFLGDCAYVRLRFYTSYAHMTGGGSVDIWCHHGTGSGVSVGSPLLKLEHQTKVWEADIFLMGHQSKIVATPIDVCSPIFPHQKAEAEPRLRHKTVLLVGTGGFMKGYVPGRKVGQVPTGTYIEKGMMRPVALGGVVITVTPRIVKEVIPGSAPRARKGRRRGEEMERPRQGYWSPDLRVSL